MDRSFTEIRASIHDYVGQHPKLYRGLSVLHPTLRRRFVSADTDLVIDGYPRTANTFAYHAFLWAQGIGVDEPNTGVAHHTHQPAQVLRAVQLQIPVVALIRDPEECVLSLVVRNPELSLRYALIKYINFYRAITGVREDIVIADFQTVTQDFGQIIQEVNDVYRASFAAFEHTLENEKQVFERIEHINNRLHEGDPRGISKPSRYKERLKEQRRAQLPNHDPLLREAELLYRKFV